MSVIKRGQQQIKSKMNPGDYMLNNGVFKALLKISIPIILLMLGDATYSIFDSAMASNLVEYGDGVNAGDVLSFTQPMMGMFMSINMIFTVGTTLAFTKSIAKGDIEEARSEFGNGLLSAGILSLGMFTMVWFIANPLIQAMGEIGTALPDIAIKQGTNYSRITIISIGMMVTRDQFGRALRSEGYGTQYSLINLIAMPINLLLNWIFMGVVETGVEGAAYATLIATFAGLIGNFGLLLWLKNENRTNISFRLKYFKLRWNYIWLIILFGISSGIRRITGSINNLTFISMTNSFGDNWKQFTNASTKIIRFSNQIGLGAAQGAAILLSFAHHREEGEKVKEISIKAMGGIMITQGIILALSMSLPTQLMGMFNMTKITTEMTHGWYLLSASNFMYSLLFIPIVYFASTKMVKESMIQATTQSIVIGIGMTLLMYGIYKWTGSQNTTIYFSFAPIATSLSLSIMLPWFFKIINRTYN